MSKLVPNLRFEGFEDKWKVSKLGKIGSVESCKRVYKKDTFGIGEIPFYKIGTFGKKADSYITRELFEEYKKKYSYPNKGDILISASGSLGRIVIYDGEDAFFQDSNIVWLAHGEKTITNKFLKQFYKQTKWNTVEGSTIKRLYNKDILEKKINYPNIEEQQKIGEFFETLDNIIEDQKQLLETKKKFKKILLQKMFPKDGKKQPQIRFKEFEGQWNQTILGDVCNIISGYAFKSSEYGKGENKLIRISNLLENGSVGGVFEYVRGNESLSDYLVKEGNYLIAMSGATTGKVAQSYITGYLNQRVGLFNTNEYLDNEFLGALISKKSFYNYVNLSWTAGAQPNISKKDLETYRFKLPSLAEQEKIGAFFKSLDEEIQSEEDKLESYKKLKKSLLQKMFV